MRFRPRASSLLAATAVSLTASPALAERVSARPPESTPIFGGELNSTCEWASAVNVQTYSGNCTGTLVHPQVVLMARHCGSGSASINFGEDANAPLHSVQGRCVGYPQFEDFQDDAAYCVLDEPITGVPPTPPLMGCETELLEPGAEVVITGYGRSDSGQRGPKRVATTELILVEDRYVELGHAGTSACHGDSGGPAFLRLPDGSWRSFGIVHGRPDVNPFDPPPDLCGAWAAYVRMDAMIGWIEADSGFDITPCHDADGTWNPGPDCSGFPLDTTGEGRSWAGWCGGSELSGYSATCGEPYASAEDPDGTGDDTSTGDDKAGDDGATADEDSDEGDTGGGTDVPPGWGQDGPVEHRDAGGCRIADTGAPLWALWLPLLLRRLS